MAAFPKTVLLLGSGELGKEVVIAAQRLGCRVIACDRYPGARRCRSLTSPKCSR